MTKCMNALLNAKIYNNFFFIPKIKQIVIRSYCMFFKLMCGMNKNVKRELYRFWKVKRTQVARVLREAGDGTYDWKQCTRSIESIIDNGMKFAATESRHTDEAYRFMVLVRLFYMLHILDNLLAFDML